MKVGLIHCIAVSIVLAILSYLLFTFVPLALPLPLAVAMAVLFGGILSPWFASLTAQTIADSSDAEDAETTTLYVGNLPYRASEDDVKNYFAEYTKVQSVRLMKDRRTGKRKGYGFVEIVANDVTSAINKLNDSIFQERSLKVRPAKDKATE